MIEMKEWKKEVEALRHALFLSQNIKDSKIKVEKVITGRIFKKTTWITVIEY